MGWLCAVERDHVDLSKCDAKYALQLRSVISECLLIPSTSCRKNEISAI